MVTTRQIGTANAAAEQYIAAHQYIILTVIKAQMRRRVAGGEDELERSVAKLQLTCFRQKHIGQEGWLVPYTRLFGPHYRDRQHLQLAPVELRLNAILVEHEAVAQHMVNMAMRVEQQHWLKALIADEVDHRVLLKSVTHAGVDDGAFVGIVV